MYSVKKGENSKPKPSNNGDPLFDYALFLMGEPCEAGNNKQHNDEKMKNQKSGRSPANISKKEDTFPSPELIPIVLRAYRKNRENGLIIDEPKELFPASGFDTFAIKGSKKKSNRHWPDSNSKYWWQLIMEDNSNNDTFSWAFDEERNRLDADPNRRWFIIYGPNNFKMEGFSVEADYEKGFPDKDENYWRYIQYTECGEIKAWMEKKDRNYLERLQNEQKNNIYNLKIRKVGEKYGFGWPIRDPISPPHFAGPYAASACSSLKEYRKNRENGGRTDIPANPFPSGGFETFDIKELQSQAGKWHDSQGRYWWTIILSDGRQVKDFYWMPDAKRGFPDIKQRHWFIVYGPNNTKIEGFYMEPDYEKGFPDKNKNYWRTIQYVECGVIKAWMEEKDRRCTVRLEREQKLRKGKNDNDMNHQVFGKSLPFWDDLPAHGAQVAFSLKNYREFCESGKQTDNPNSSFPSAGFDTLDIKSSCRQAPDKWPDKQGRYWWKFTLNNGCVNNDFYWTKDEIRGYPDQNEKNRYWFVVHHAPSNTKIEGFSQEPDYEQGFPDKDKHYWYYMKYTECGAIRKWVETKYRNYRDHLKCGTDESTNSTNKSLI